MEKLILFNCILIAVITVLLIFVKRAEMPKRAQRILLLSSALVTVIFHYSELIFRVITDNDPMFYAQDNLNLLLPIYPCNVVMWSCLILPFLKDEHSFLAKLFCDYIFWFGIFSTLVGMFANVDFIMNPTLRDYGIVKSIVAHATLLFNVMLLPIFGRVKIDFPRNMKNIFLSVVGMYLIGLYCNLLLYALSSAEVAYDENSMFIIHSPFEALPFLKYPVIAVAGLLLYFILFNILEIIRFKKGNRWFDKIRIIKNRKEKS